MRRAVKVVSPLPERETLQEEQMCDVREAGSAALTGPTEECEGLTDTGPLCPVNLYRRLHVSASQIMMNLFMSPVALKDVQMHHLYIQATTNAFNFSNFFFCSAGNTFEFKIRD